MEDALAAIPRKYREAMVNVQIEVRARPGREASKFAGKTLLGLYFGPPRQAMTSPFGGSMPPGRIILYQRNLESLAQDEAELKAEIARTLKHEIAHHFGFTEEGIPREAGGGGKQTA